MKSRLALSLALGGLLCVATPALAEQRSLPTVILARAGVSLQPVGEGTYRKFGFSIYHAVLWAPGGVWDPEKPYALELRYMRDLSHDTLADSVIDDIHDENAADAQTMTRWTVDIKNIIPAVNDGDVMIGMIAPDKKALLFLNGVQIAKIDDKTLSKAFLNIWLGEGADETLKSKLLGQKPE